MDSGYQQTVTRILVQEKIQKAEQIRQGRLGGLDHGANDLMQGGAGG